MSNRIHDIIACIRWGKFDLTHEKTTQEQMHAWLNNQHGYKFLRHHPLDKANIPDFFLDGIAIEVKIKGGKKAIYKQCVRYCSFEAVKVLILCSNKSMGFPAEINGKPCYFINLGKAWL